MDDEELREFHEYLAQFGLKPGFADGLTNEDRAELLDALGE